MVHDIGRVLLAGVPDVPAVEAVHPLEQAALDASNSPANSHGCYRSVGSADSVWAATAFRISVSSCGSKKRRISRPSGNSSITTARMASVCHGEVAGVR